MNRRKLTASENAILTDGEIYGKIIFLGEGMNADAFHEITEEEYLAKMRESEKNQIGETI